MKPSDRLEFRPACSTDGLEIYQIFREAFRAPIEGDLKTLKDTHVGVLDGEVVSVGVLNVYPKKRCVYLHSFAVKESHRRLGIGRRFLQHFIQLACTADAKEFFLHARETNPASHPLYFGAGFDYFVPPNLWSRMGVWLDAAYWLLMGQKAPVMLVRSLDDASEEKTNSASAETGKDEYRSPF